MDGASMIKARLAILTATVMACVAATPALSQQQRVLRYGSTGGWSFDARNDDRDAPSNGFFPGNFARNPLAASIGAAGFLESNPHRSVAPYPSQVVFGPLVNGPTVGHVSCRHHRAYDPTSGTYRSKDGVRHPC
jgi:hypothetical protein